MGERNVARLKYNLATQVTTVATYARRTTRQSDHTWVELNSIQPNRAQIISSSDNHCGNTQIHNELNRLIRSAQTITSNTTDATHKPLA